MGAYGRRREKTKERERAAWAPWASFLGISRADAGVTGGGGAVLSVWKDQGKERQASALLAASLAGREVRIRRAGW